MLVYMIQGYDSVYVNWISGNTLTSTTQRHLVSNEKGLVRYIYLFMMRSNGIVFIVFNQ